MTTFAKKNYEMIECPCCDGKGRGKNWVCENCDNGRVSKYPAKRIVSDNSSFYERQAGA